MAILFSHLLTLVLLSVPYHNHVSGYNYPYYPQPRSNVIMNPVDACWATNKNWASNRKALADCTIGFGRDAMGGKYGRTYVVTDPSDNAARPKPGTLRYAVTRWEPLWIVFAKDMVIRLQNELMVGSFKTIDGRGRKVEIGYGPCVTIQNVDHVIIHGISIHDCKPGKDGMVSDSPRHTGRRHGSDGDAIAIFASSNIWIDHCILSSAYDGLIDIIHGSTAVTITNSYFSHHDKVILFGHHDGFIADKKMKVTVAFNRFGKGLVQRMPRVRMGYTHVANNRYDQWEMYAIGGSSNPTIFSEGNYYVAPKSSNRKQVTKREEGGWKNWKWRSSKDYFLNSAYFVQSGWGSCSPGYSPNQKFIVLPGSVVPLLTKNAGVLKCVVGKPCLI